jgi:hypothetical protein
MFPSLTVARTAAPNKIITIHIGNNSVKIGKKIWEKYNNIYRGKVEPVPVYQSWTLKPVEQQLVNIPGMAPAFGGTAALAVPQQQVNLPWMAMAFGGSAGPDPTGAESQFHHSSAQSYPLLDDSGNPRAVYVDNNADIKKIMNEIEHKCHISSKHGVHGKKA